MSLPVLVDMNLSVEWIPFLSQAGWKAIHWSSVGDICADDAAIMGWAASEQHVVFTHDLDFGTALALSHASGPSVIQVRGSQVFPEQIGQLVLSNLRKYEPELAAGALIVIEPFRSRVRILPL